MKESDFVKSSYQKYSPVGSGWWENNITGNFEYIPNLPINGVEHAELIISRGFVDNHFRKWWRSLYKTDLINFLEVERKKYFERKNEHNS